MTRTVCASALAIGLLCGAPACRSAVPARDTRLGTSGRAHQHDAERHESSSAAQPTFTTADVEFMQGLVGHHAQALDLVELLRTRSSNDALQRLANGIERSRTAEIAAIQDWLTARGQIAPERYAHHGEVPMMPGMLTRDEVAQLASTRGREFEERFLRAIVAHDEGAMQMIASLRRVPNAAREPSIAAFIARMETAVRDELVTMRDLPALHP